MPTPLARLLRALGGGRLPPDALQNTPKFVISCTDPEGPDFDLPIRDVFDDLTDAEQQAYEKHLADCAFCRKVHEDALKQDWSELRAVLTELGIDASGSTD